MIIRQANDDDKEQVFKTMQVWAAEFSIDYSPEKLMAEVENFLKFGHIIVGIEDASVCGFLICEFKEWKWRGQTVGDEKMFYVKPEWRGCGLAQLLTQAYEVTGKAYGCSELYFSPNTLGSDAPERARKHMEKAGYSFYGYLMKKEI